jgi:hypothetical protein
MELPELCEQLVSVLESNDELNSLLPRLSRVGEDPLLNTAGESE